MAAAKNPKPRPKKFRDLPLVSPPKINGEETSTLLSRIVDNHYLRLNLKTLWTPERVNRMCGYLRWTVYELSSMINLPHTDMKKYLAKGTFPDTVCWSLTFIEVCLMPNVLKDYPLSPGETFIPTVKN